MEDDIYKAQLQIKNRGDATPPYVEVKGSTFPKIHSFEMIMALRTLYVKDFFFFFALSEKPRLVHLERGHVER